MPALSFQKLCCFFGLVKHGPPGNDDLHAHYNPNQCSSDSISSSEEEEAKLLPSNIYVFASSSTLHGFNHIFAHHHSTLRRVFWFMAFASSLVLFFYQSSNRAQYYLSFPHVTRLDEVAAGDLSFPAVTICNLNEFKFSKVTRNDMFFAGALLRILDDSGNLIPADFYTDLESMEDGPTKTRLRILKERIDYLTNFEDPAFRKKPFSMQEFYNRTSHNLSEFLLGCTYRGFACNHTWFTQVYTRYGKCYTFNSGETLPLLRTLKGGVDNGLEILLDTEQDDYMPVWSETDEISVEAGFKVQVHVQSEPPFIHELGFGISPGFQTLVATQEQRITFLPQPYGVCESGKNRTKHLHYKTYSISACRITCETQYVVGMCGCRMIHMPGNASFCSPEQYKKCADDKLDFLVDSDEKICVCGTPCEVIRYNLEMSSLQLPSTQALSYMAYKYQKSEEYVKNNFVKLNIFFEALNYETIEQKKAYEIPGLLGDIGGQMGLFIGASILTLLELFDYFYEVIKFQLQKRRQKKKSREMTSKMDSTEMEVVHSTHQQDNHVVSLSPYAPSSHLSPTQDFSSISRPFLESRPNNKESYYHSPVPQYLGNSFMTLRADRLQDKEGEAVASQQLNHPSQMLLKRGRETSLSYNDLYRAPESNWPNRDHPINNVAQRGLNSNTLGPPKMAYEASSTTPISSRSYLRNRGDYGMVNEKQKSSAMLSSSPGCPLVAEDFPVSIETDIH